MIERLLKKPLVSGLIFAVFPAVQLLWEHTHGGIVRHYLLQREDLPSFSNAWGLLTLPLLAFAAIWFVKRRIRRAGARKPGTSEGEAHQREHASCRTRMEKFVAIGFLGGLVLGGLMAFFWAMGLSDYMPFLMLFPLVLAFFVPTYRPECLLGFVLGMSWTFGGVLPVGIGLLLALGSWMIYKGIRVGILRLVGR